MFCRKGAFLILTAAMLAALLLAPVSSDAAEPRSIECQNVKMALTGDSFEMNSLKSYPILIHLYNGNASTVSLKISDKNDSVINMSYSGGEILLDAGKTAEVSAKLITDRYTPMGDYSISIVLSVMDGTGGPYEATMTIPVLVTSNYSSGGNFNKFFGIFENNFPAPFNHALVTAGITLALWIGISIVAGFISLLVLKTIFRITDRDSDTLGKNTVIGVFACVLLFGIKNSAQIAGANEMIIEQLTIITGTLYILFVAMIIWDLYKALITGALTKAEKRGSGGLDSSLIPLFKTIGKIVIILICITLILSKFGVNFVTLVTTAGLTGLGLSFGVKPAINELFSGIIVLVTRPFKTGDYVTVGSDDRLQVREIGILRTTFVTGYSNEVATMPNSKIASSKIVNISHRTVKFRNTVSFKVPFDSNLTLVRKIAKKVASNHPNIVTDGSVAKPNAVFSKCDDGSAVVVTLSFYVNDYDNNKTTTCQIREGIINELRERDIKIPLNKTEVTIMNGGQSNAQ